jgi:molecular chaperone GrpE
MPEPNDRREGEAPSPGDAAAGPVSDPVSPPPAQVGALRSGLEAPAAQVGALRSGLEAPAAETVSAEELARLRKLAEERDEFLDLLKRVKADFANYRKRMEAERAAFEAAGERRLLAKLLAVADQCELACEGAGRDCSADSLRQALSCVWSEMDKFLKDAGVERIEAAGKRFTPESHEAVHVVESAELPERTVVEEVSPGYRVGDHVLRPARVVVTRRPAQAADPAGKPPAPQAEGPGGSGGGQPA